MNVRRKTRSGIACLMMGLVATTAMANDIPQPFVEHANDLIDRQQARALAIAIHDDGKTAFAGLGAADANGGELQETSLFEIGSISKVFTALLVERLASADRLSWDDTLAEALPDLEFASQGVAAIRLRELASHTSGLPRLPDNMPMTDPLDPYADFDRALLFDFIANYDPDTLDKSYEYSNLGAGLLGEVAAIAAGKSYADAMAEWLLEPLGMSATGVGLPTGEIPPGRLVTGFSQGADMPYWSGFDALAGAGALMSSAGDMMRFAVQNLERSAALPEELEAIRVPQVPGEVALGWHLRAHRDGIIYWHNGGTGGFASCLLVQPASGRAVVVLASSTAYNEITEFGFALLDGSVERAVSADSVAYTGSFQLAPGFLLNVFIDDGRLMAQATGQGAFPLTSTGEREYTFDAADIRIVFDPVVDGVTPRLTLYQGGGVRPAERVGDAQARPVYDEIEIDTAVLADYVGRYRLAEGTFFMVEARGGQLFAQLSRQPAYPVFPYDEDRFFYKVVDAQLVFERDASGAVSALVLHQGGEQRAVRVPD